ncbi:MAG: class I SAM-dependent methyltransferase [Pseudorhodobacter sp.]
MASNPYASQRYWRERSDMIYYRYIDYMVRCVGKDAQRMLDVGSGNCPYPEWFDWIETRISVDIRVPYASDKVQGIQGDIHELDLGEPFDLVTCFQVLEHVPDATRFARRLLDLGRLLMVSVPYNWPTEPPTPGHVHDPVSDAKLDDWMGREANYKMVVREPFSGPKGARLIAFYDENPKRKFNSALAKGRRIRMGDGL